MYIQLLFILYIFYVLIDYILDISTFLESSFILDSIYHLLHLSFLLGYL